MDFRDHARDALSRLDLPNRIRAVSTGRHTRKALGALFLLLALGCGFWAQEFSTAQAYDRFLRTHAPTASIWRYALEAYGLRPVSEEALKKRVLRSLPLTLDGIHSVWASADRRWIVIFQKSEGAPPWVYSTETRIPKGAHPSSDWAGWQRLGEAWNGFDRLFSELKGLALKPGPDPSRLRPSKYREKPLDPLAIRY